MNGLIYPAGGEGASSPSEAPIGKLGEKRDAAERPSLGLKVVRKNVHFDDGY